MLSEATRKSKQSRCSAGKKIVLTFTFLAILVSGINLYAQWAHVSNGLPNTDYIYLASNGSHLFAGVSIPEIGVYVTTNHGNMWTQTSLVYKSIQSFTINGNYIFAGTANFGVYLSTNNGTTWSQTSLDNRSVWTLANNGNIIFAGTFNYGVYLSTNNGTTWSQTSLDYHNIQSLAVNGNNIFAGTANYGVYLSTNNGTSWIQTSLNNRTVAAFALNGNNIFAGCLGNYGVWLSTNYGTSWSQTSLNNQNVSSLAISGNYIFAGTIGNSGIYVSTNNGVSWSQRNEGLGGYSIVDLCIVENNNYLFASIANGNVYRRPLSELTGIHPISTEVPNQFSLSQNYPNPFNPSTKIKFAVPLSPFEGGRGMIRLVIYDVLGREVATLVNEQLSPGTYEVDWDGSNFSSGIYYYTLQTEAYTETRKMVLMK